MSLSRQFFCCKPTDGISCVPVSIEHRSLETRINLSALSPQPKIDHFKQVDLFLFFTKTMFSIWVNTVQ